jgi:hypothetical protein
MINEIWCANHEWWIWRDVVENIFCFQRKNKTIKSEELLMYKGRHGTWILVCTEVSRFSLSTYVYWQSCQYLKVQRSVNDELERMWKEVDMTSFEILSWHLPRGIEKRHTKPQSGQSAPQSRFKLDTSGIQVRSIITWANLLSLFRFHGSVQLVLF